MADTVSSSVMANQYASNPATAASTNTAANGNTTIMQTRKTATAVSNQRNHFGSVLKRLSELKCLSMREPPLQSVDQE